MYADTLDRHVSEMTTQINGQGPKFVELWDPEEVKWSSITADKESTEDRKMKAFGQQRQAIRDVWITYLIFIFINVEKTG